MSKIKVVRASGDPVSIEHIDRFKQEFAETYDRVAAHVGLVGNELVSEEQAQRMNKLLQRLEKRLLKKYPAVTYWEPFTTQAEQEAAVKQYGPIMIAYDKDNAALSYVIFDIQV